MKYIKLEWQKRNEKVEEVAVGMIVGGRIAGDIIREC